MFKKNKTVTKTKVRDESVQLKNPEGIRRQTRVKHRVEHKETFSCVGSLTKKC